MSLRLATLGDLFKAVSDPNRLRILKCLQVRSACVCELVQATEMPQSRVSRHLRMLHEAGLVVDDRQGQWVEYSLAEKREGSAKAQILAMALDMLEGDAQVAADLRRLATASREQCDAAHP